MSDAPTPADLAGLTARHRRFVLSTDGSAWCAEDDYLWPCDTASLLALVAAQAEQIAELQEQDERNLAEMAELTADLEAGDACGAVGCRALRDRDGAMAAVERVRGLCDEGDGPHGDYSVRTYELRAALASTEPTTSHLAEQTLDRVRAALDDDQRSSVILAAVRAILDGER